MSQNTLFAILAIAVVIGIGLYLMRGKLGSFVVTGPGGVKAEAKAQPGPSASENVLKGERQEIEATGPGSKADKNQTDGKDIKIKVGP